MKMLSLCDIYRLRLHMVVVEEVHHQWIGTAAATVGAVHLRDGPTIVVCIVFSVVLFAVVKILHLKTHFINFYDVNIQCL